MEFNGADASPHASHNRECCVAARGVQGMDHRGAPLAVDFVQEGCEQFCCVWLQIGKTGDDSCDGVSHSGVYATFNKRGDA
jgi:hypothetical protein